ncbi:hypothetical protein M0R19_05685 [Candidatus Pacearchaeota archaeon]|nr:hypothetical protein [Candidatus Pacearchaeota archaeon]
METKKVYTIKEKELKKLIKLLMKKTKSKSLVWEFHTPTSGYLGIEYFKCYIDNIEIRLNIHMETEFLSYDYSVISILSDEWEAYSNKIDFEIVYNLYAYVKNYLDEISMKESLAEEEFHSFMKGLNKDETSKMY